jgi:signal peptidase
MPVRIAVALLGGLVAGVLLATVLAVAVPRALGWQPMTVLTGSMRPVLNPGDVVVDRMIAPADARPGDIVTFHDPTRGGELVTHRVRFVRRDGATVNVVTRGDANTASEHWSIADNGRIGRVAYRVPAVGWAGQWLRTPLGRLLAIALPALLLAVVELRAVWRRPSPAAP